MTVRLIVLDLDGTLLGADNRLSPYTIATLERARAAGLTLMAATGRSRWATDLVLDGTTAVDWAICSNGTALYHRPTGETVWCDEITPHLTTIYDAVNTAIPGACWAWETEAGVVADATFRRIGETPGQELDELLASPRLDLPGDDATPIAERLAPFGKVVRGMLTHPDLPTAEIVARLPEAVPALISSSAAIFLEVTAPGVHKGAMLERFCTHHGIAAAEVVAFGDHMNDLQMLRWAGRGIGMRGGHAALLAQVAEVTDLPHHEDGAALAIDKLVADL